MKKFLFLHSELSGYFLACVHELARSGCEVHIVKMNVNHEAPFNFDRCGDIYLYERNRFNGTSLLALANRLCPDAIVCSGWFDREYLQTCRAMRHRSTNILAFDTPWNATLKQRIAQVLGRSTISKWFQHAWVAGDSQSLYAKKLGFASSRVWNGVYTADTNLFGSFYANFKDVKSLKLPHKLLFVGRYVKTKGIEDLCGAFSEIRQEVKSDWELWCLGTGEYIPPPHANIRHFGFVQPQDIGSFVRDTSVFVMPSHYEPWGVVLHEFVTAGFPVVCSDAVHSSERFVREGVNGHRFSAGNRKSLKEKILQVIQKTDEELLEMGRQSEVLGSSWTLSGWTLQLLEMVSIPVDCRN